VIEYYVYGGKIKRTGAQKKKKKQQTNDILHEKKQHIPSRGENHDEVWQ